MSLSILKRHFRTGLTLVALLCTTDMVVAQKADRRLEAIKQALIDLSLGNELKLATSAYIDSRGVLHESSLVTSQSQVRGIRVLSYLEESGISTASLDAVMAASKCAISRPGLRREVLVTVDYGENNPLLGAHYLSEVAALALDSSVAALSDSVNWAAVGQQKFSDRYHQRVAASNNTRPPFELQITLGKASPKRATKGELMQYYSKQSAKALFYRDAKISLLKNGQSWPSQRLAWHLSLFDPVLGKVILAEEGKITYPSTARGFKESYLPERFVGDLTTLSQRFVAAADELLQCMPRYYHASRSASQQGFVAKTSGESADRVGLAAGFKINGGKVAGVKIGDQFLLSRTLQVTGEGASLSDIENLVLAEVQQVSQHSAVLTAVAGQQPLDATAGHQLDNSPADLVAIYF